jgi:hypothetical protein
VKITKTLAALSPGMSFALSEAPLDVCRDKAIIPKATHFGSKSRNEEVARDTGSQGAYQELVET